MYWSYIQWLAVFLITIQSVYSFHSQLPRSKGGRIKRFSAVLKLLESSRGREFHENVQRRKNKLTLEKLQQLLTALQNEQESENESPETNALIFAAPLESSEEISEDDIYDNNGMIHLTKPKPSDHGVLNNALNKATILLNDPSDQQDLMFTPAEMRKLRTMLKEDSKTRLLRTGLDEGGIPQPSQTVYRFDDLVA